MDKQSATVELVLNPVASSIENLVLYETKTRYYLVGSNNTETKFRVLKIDRTEPRELVVIDDKVEYNQRQIRDLLVMINSGNKVQQGRAYSAKGIGMQRRASGYGLLGFVRFLEGYYIVLITKKTCAALIGGHTIYKIADTVMIPIPNDTVKWQDINESRYVKIFQNVDLSSNFYFSYSYDLTHPLQHNMRSRDYWQQCSQLSFVGVPWPRCQRFVWNNFLVQEVEKTIHRDWILPVVHGFIHQANLSVFGRPVYVCLIARRSKEYAGTRFLKRGANDQGDVANEVETEQIVHDSSTLAHNTGLFTSYVQLRGSVPLFWSQESSGMTPKPPIIIDRVDPFATATAMHFNYVFERYGAPIFILNLVKKREHRPRESILSADLVASLDYLNQFLPPEYAIEYIAFDMARFTKSKEGNVLSRLEAIADNVFQKTGFFHGGPELTCNSLHSHDKYSMLGGMPYRPSQPYRLQTGVVRVNCVDCLDRTNTAQFMLGKHALGYQLYTLGVIDNPVLDLDSDAMRMFEQLYEDHGDFIALQYGGSQLVHRIRTYRKLAAWTSHSMDIMHTISRYYSNAFNDQDKQCAINLFLGKFVPHPGKPMLWELPTDYYLHHTESSGEEPHSISYTNWLNPILHSWLPAPLRKMDLLAVEHTYQETGAGSVERSSRLPSASVSPSKTIGDRVDQQRAVSDSYGDILHKPVSRRIKHSGTYLRHTFLDYYKPWLLSGFEEFDFCHSMVSTAQHMPTDSQDISPFVVRQKVKKTIIPRAGVGPRNAVGGSPSVHSSDSDSPDEGAESSDDDVSSLGRPSYHNLSAGGHHSKSWEVKLPSTQDAYGYHGKQPNESDFLLYGRYVEQHKAVTNAASAQSSTHMIWEQASNLSGASSCEVDWPVVTDSSFLAFCAVVRVAVCGPTQPAAADIASYNQYSQQYQAVSSMS